MKKRKVKIYVRQKPKYQPEPTFSCWLLAILIDGPHDDKQNGVGNGLVELTGMAWYCVYTLKDKCPGYVGHLTDNL